MIQIRTNADKRRILNLTDSQFRYKKYLLPAFFLSLFFLPALLRAQTLTQGFFLDNWLPKNIEMPVFDTVSQTTEPASVTVTIDAGNPIAKVSQYVYGHNAAAWGGKLEQNSKLVSDVSNLAPHVIRWPGGNMSNEYFWNASSKATCPKDLPPTFAYGDLLYGANKNSWTMSLDSYYSFLSKTNSKGIISVNYSYARYGTGKDPVAIAAKLAADWVRYDNGRTQYWEIGNENFGNWQAGYIIDQSLNKDGQPKTITGDLYGKHCKVFIAEMRKAAKEVGNDIKIGVVAMDSHVTWDAVQMNWNSGMMKQVANDADFIIVHNYYTPYNENSNVTTVLNSANRTKDFKKYVTDGLKTNASHDPLPLALTEWNIFATGGGQAVSYINGIHATLVLGELLKNEYGQGSRWDFMNGWDNGNSHGLFADGEPNIARYTPRAPFFYMYYFQKFFGDKIIASTVTGSTDMVSYASEFSSGQTSVVLVNKGTTEKTVNITINNFNAGDRYYYYLLTGGTDNGDFSRKVHVNGKTTTGEGGGPSDYATLKPYGTFINGDIKISLPKWATVFVVVENDKDLLPQTIQFEPIPSKVVGDTNFVLAATSESGLPVMFASSTPSVATIQNGIVHIVGAGTCSIIAYQDGNDVYLPAVQTSQDLIVAKGNQTITFPVIDTKKLGDPDFSAGAFTSSGLECTYVSSNPSVASVSNGQIQVKAAGTAIITSKQPGNVNYNAAPDISQEMVVLDPTSIESTEGNCIFEILPNPVADVVRIHLTPGKSLITIYNTLGSVVYSFAVCDSETSIPVSQIGNNGLYFVQVNSSVKKLCIAR